jgi:hypothetical protein
MFWPELLAIFREFLSFLTYAGYAATYMVGTATYGYNYYYYYED